MKSLAYNNKAKFDYDIKETLDAGLVLDGHEVKSAKTGNVSLAGSYVKINTDGAYLLNAPHRAIQIRTPRNVRSNAYPKIIAQAIRN